MIRRGIRRSRRGTACRRHTSGVMRRSHLQRCRTRTGRQVPAGEKAVAEGAPKRIARSQAAHDFDTEGRDPFTNATRGGDETPSPPSLTTAASIPVEQCVGSPIRIGLATRDLALVAIADRDGDPIHHPGKLGGRGGRSRPELRAPIEVEHGVRASIAPSEKVVKRGAARFGGQTRRREPQDRYRFDDPAVDVGGVDHHVRRLRLAVEVDIRFGGVFHRRKHDRSAQVGVRAKKGDVDTEGLLQGVRT